MQPFESKFEKLLLWFIIYRLSEESNALECNLDSTPRLSGIWTCEIFNNFGVLSWFFPLRNHFDDATMIKEVEFEKNLLIIEIGTNWSTNLWNHNRSKISNEKLYHLFLKTVSVSQILEYLNRETKQHEKKIHKISWVIISHKAITNISFST